MKKYQLYAVTALAAGVMAFGTACSSGAAGKNTGAARTTEAATEAVTETVAEAVTETAGNSIETSEDGQAGQITGILDENKGFMFILQADDGETYAINISDENLLEGVEPGDKVVVTYKGEAPDSTNVTDTQVISVEKAQ